jgi:small subunit ribosomal protein S6
MPVYDSTFVLNPQIEEGGLDSRIKEAVDLINSHGGKVIRENRLGMRRMAYEIQKLTQGYYVSLVFEGSQETVTELERRFRLDESCLRFLTCHYQDFSRKRERKETVKKVPVEEAAPAEPEVPTTTNIEKPVEETPAPAETEETQKDSEA